MGDKVKFKVVGDIPSLFGELDKGSIDTIANSVTVLLERQKKYNFSPVYSYYAAQITVKKDSKYKTIKDLEGKTVSATVGSSNIDLLKKYDPKIKIKKYDDRNAVFTDANNGTVAGVVNHHPLKSMALRIWMDAVWPPILFITPMSKSSVPNASLMVRLWHWVIFFKLRWKTIQP